MQLLKYSQKANFVGAVYLSRLVVNYINHPVRKQKHYHVTDLNQVSRNFLNHLFAQ